MSQARDHFPFVDFRQYQADIIEKIQNEFENGTDVVILEGPTGFGKSPVNIALGLYFEPSYYSTPQTKLVEQLANDFGPKKLVIDGGQGDCIPLLARKRYICKKTNQDSYHCKINKNPNLYCSNQKECTYWNQKKGVFNSKVGILTFSNLIINQYLPVFTDGLKCPQCNNEYIEFNKKYFCFECDYKGNKEKFEYKKQISFEKRNLLIIDECHSLEEQIASLHAGFTITPNSIPNTKKDNFLIDLQKDFWQFIDKYIPSKKGIKTYKEMKNFINKTKRFLDKCNPNKEAQNQKEADYKTIIRSNRNFQKKISNFEHKIKYMEEEIELGRTWVVNIREISRPFKTLCPYFKPIKIDRFLQTYIWSYANKYLLTSATIPYPNNIKEWLKRIGLGDKSYKFLKVPMNFPVKNRPIYLKMSGSLNHQSIEKNWDKCVKTVREILSKHKGEKGVIHCHSFKNMWRLNDDLKNEYSIFLHNKNLVGENNVIESWIKSKRDIIISPSIYEGVDLKDDLCRFQILFKIPFGFLGDARTNHLLFKEHDNEWYQNETALKIIQAYGRGVRHDKDYASFYIIDSSFENLYFKVSFPEWFREAIVNNVLDIEW